MKGSADCGKMWHSMCTINVISCLWHWVSIAFYYTHNVAKVTKTWGMVSIKISNLDFLKKTSILYFYLFCVFVVVFVVYLQKGGGSYYPI
jgi:hypothetical protein